MRSQNKYTPKFEFETNLYVPRCLKLLRHDDLSTEQIAKEMDLSVPHTLMILKRLEDDRKIRRANGKYYAIGAAK
jgi:predicted Rossmann fold nucleotide-binding protein DprA/Smf involved in DNA uptake